MGWQNVCWGSDYPHLEGTFGHTQKTLHELFDDVDAVGARSHHRRRVRRAVPARPARARVHEPRPVLARRQGRDRHRWCRWLRRGVRARADHRGRAGRARRSRRRASRTERQGAARARSRRDRRARRHHRPRRGRGHGRARHGRVRRRRHPHQQRGVDEGDPHGLGPRPAARVVGAGDARQRDGRARVRAGCGAVDARTRGRPDHQPGVGWCVHPRRRVQREQARAA